MCSSKASVFCIITLYSLDIITLHGENTLWHSKATAGEEKQVGFSQHSYKNPISTYIVYWFTMIVRV